EGEQDLAAFLGGSPPVATPEVIHVGDAPGPGVDQRLVRAGEELLMPESVEGDDDDVLRPAWRPIPPRRTGDGQDREEADCDAEPWRHESLCGRSLRLVIPERSDDMDRTSRGVNRKRHYSRRSGRSPSLFRPPSPDARS